MIAVIGANGQTGGAVARCLLARGHATRVVLRQEAQADAWRRTGADAVVADVADAEALAAALDGCSQAYLMNPPAYHAPDVHRTAHATHLALVGAVAAAGLERVVALSSVGAQHARGTGNILTTHDFEQVLRQCPAEVTVLRAANFMENWSWALAPVRDAGILQSMFLPLDRPLPMVSVADIGVAAAELLTDAAAPAVVELHGPAPSSPQDAAEAFSRLLGKPVQAVAVPRGEWPATFAGAGLPPRSVQAFCEMYDGFNDGLIAFEGTHVTRHGSVSLAAALEALLA